MDAKNLGEILLEQGIIGREALEKALQIQGRRLGEILIQERLAEPAAIANALKLQARTMPGRRVLRRAVDATAVEELLIHAETLEDQLFAAKIPTDSDARLALARLRFSIESILLESPEVLFAKARAVAEKAADELGKRIDLAFQSDFVAADRVVLDELADALVHLVRNAVDHGIETPERRAAAGKDASGKITISLSMAGGNVILGVADDGVGVDEDAIFETASKKGLLKKKRSEASSQELQRLIFASGFSTRGAASTISGRGVGLDVVESTAIRLGGSVDVKSESGRGATFSAKVPIPFSRVSLVPLRVGSDWLALPAARIFSMKKADASTKARRAASLFDGTGPSPATVGSEIEIELTTGETWLFDDVTPPEDALVKTIPPLSGDPKGLVGGVRLGDGRIVLLLELPETKSS